MSELVLKLKFGPHGLLKISPSGCEKSYRSTSIDEVFNLLQKYPDPQSAPMQIMGDRALFEGSAYQPVTVTLAVADVLKMKKQGLEVLIKPICG